MSASSGTNCEDTKAFVAAANIKGDDAFLKTCKDQLDGTGMDFGKIDYGYRIRRFTIAQLVGIGVGGGVGFLILVSLVIGCCCCCR
jgi:hypothetical protein